MSDSGATWKEKAKGFLKVGVVIALFIWAFSVAQGARSTATENADRLSESAFDYSFVPGGPQRFQESYGEVLNADTEKQIQESDYLWTTLIVENTSFGETGELELKLQTTAPVAQTLVSAPGYQNEASVSTGEQATVRNITLDSLNSRERAFIFLGLSPEQIPALLSTATVSEGSRWARDYQYLLERLVVDSDDTDVTFYGAGVPSYY